MHVLAPILTFLLTVTASTSVMAQAAPGELEITVVIPGIESSPCLQEAEQFRLSMGGGLFDGLMNHLYTGLEPDQITQLEKFLQSLGQQRPAELKKRLKLTEDATDADVQDAYCTAIRIHIGELFGIVEATTFEEIHTNVAKEDASGTQ